MVRGASDAAVGMMDAAYFTGRKELLDFFNGLLDLNLTKIEQTASGAVACQLTDYIYPGSIPMQRVNWEAKSDYEFVQNYKLLQAAFSKNNVQRHVDVPKLIRAKYQDNLEFCQWLKAFFDQSAVDRPDYDPVAVRARGKGGKKVNQFLNNTASKHGSKPVPVASRTNTARPRPTGPAKKPVPAKPAVTKTTTRQATATKQAETRSAAKTKPAPNPPPPAVPDEALVKEVEDLTSKLLEMETAVLEAEKERDFYFGKLRNVEVLLQVHQEKGDGSDPSVLVDNIFKILYATAEDEIAVNDDGELLTSTNDEAEESLLDS